MNKEFSDIAYLADGNERQRHCFEVLTRTRVMEILRPYGALLAGTIPLGIDVDSSDLDIVCEVHDTTAFADFMKQNFGQYEDFSIRCFDRDRVVAGFFEGDEEVEVFGSPVPPELTHGYRHMLIEYRLLNILGEQFREQVETLKRRGVKTEPAFAWLLGLQGDPYKAVLDLESYTDDQLADFFLR